MKAIEWYEKLKAEKTTEGVQNALGNCLEGLIDDTNHLIKIRKAKSDEAVRKCIMEVNDKWIAIVNLHEKNRLRLDQKLPFADMILDKDGFKAAYVSRNPKRGWFFDVKKHMTRMEQKQEEIAIKNFQQQFGDLTDPTLILFGLTPYSKWEAKEYKKGDILEEKLGALYTLSKTNNNDSFSIPQKMMYMRIIAKYIASLDYWIEIEKIDISLKNMSLEEIKRLIENGDLALTKPKTNILGEECI